MIVNFNNLSVKKVDLSSITNPFIKEIKRRNGLTTISVGTSMTYNGFDRCIAKIYINGDEICVLKDCDNYEWISSDTTLYATDITVKIEVQYFVSKYTTPKFVGTKSASANCSSMLICSESAVAGEDTIISNG